VPVDPTIPYQDLTYKTIGAGMKVHGNLGPGLKEDHYQRALAIELRQVELVVSEEHYVEINYEDEWLGRLYLDLLVEDSVIVEIKSFPHLLTNEETAQVICYLAATGVKVALLLNFGRRRLEYKRILPPRILDGWQQRIQRFLWRPKDLTQPPLD
jgi:GxxExxY protein